MRLAWFTPLGQRSAIGDFSRHVTAALAAHADVELWTADREPPGPAPVPVRRFSRAAEVSGALAGYDAVVYNLGNHLGFHGEILDVSREHPGVVLLHDRVLHHMLAGAWQRDPTTFAAVYAARMAAHHGERGAQVAREVLAGTRRPPWERDEEVAEFPLDTEPLRGALGAVTHSRHHAQSLRARWLGPVLALPHPCYADIVERADAPSPPRADGRVRLTTIGHVIANKCVDRVIGMLVADRRLAEAVHYTVAGQIDEGSAYGEELERLVRAHPHVSVELLGWCEPERLDAVIAATDVFVNLRRPVFESGSGSLARELAAGRAILCFDAGSFGELPAGAAAAVPAGDFAAAAGELARLVADSGRRAALGAGARALARERSEASYARALLDFLPEVQRAAPGLTLLDRVAGELAAMRADPVLPVYDTIARDFGRALAP